MTDFRMECADGVSIRVQSGDLTDDFDVELQLQQAGFFTSAHVPDWVICDLTRDEARKLAAALLNAAEEAK